MGWDCYALYKGKTIKVNWSWQGFKKNFIADSKLRGKFKYASDKVKRTMGSVDGMLELAGLDCSDCAHALQDSTGMSCWSENDLKPGDVKEYYNNADWDNIRKGLSPSLVESAKEFLRVCANNNLGIRFSW